VAISLNLSRNGAVGFIGWLDGGLNNHEKLPLERRRVMAMTEIINARTEATATANQNQLREA
jgi:hypothetical protein